MHTYREFWCHGREGALFDQKCDSGVSVCPTSDEVASGILDSCRRRVRDGTFVPFPYLRLQSDASIARNVAAHGCDTLQATFELFKPMFQAIRENTDPDMAAKIIRKGEILAILQRARNVPDNDPLRAEMLEIINQAPDDIDFLRHIDAVRLLGCIGALVQFVRHGDFCPTLDRMTTFIVRHCSRTTQPIPANLKADVKRFLKSYINMAGGGFLRKMKCGLLIGVAALAIFTLALPAIAFAGAAASVNVIGEVVLDLTGKLITKLSNFAGRQYEEGFPEEDYNY